MLSRNIPTTQQKHIYIYIYTMYTYILITSNKQKVTASNPGKGEEFQDLSYIMPKILTNERLTMG